MNRRTFLKSIATVCGAAVVCPGELLKPVQSDPGFYDFNPFGSEANRKKYRQNIKCYGKHGQHCCCNSCVNDIMTDCLPPLKFRGTPIVYRSPLYDET